MTDNKRFTVGKFRNETATYQRMPHDAYHSPPDVPLGLAVCGHQIPRVVLEPCCGVGGISTVLQDLGHEVISSDIRTDTGFGTGGINFLSTHYGAKSMPAVITNPPFNLINEIIMAAVEVATEFVAIYACNHHLAAIGRTRMMAELGMTHAHFYEYAVPFLVNGKWRAMIKHVWLVFDLRNPPATPDTFQSSWIRRPLIQGLFEKLYGISWSERNASHQG